MMKVSVIVPVYKVESYIHRCVNSILGQTLEDIEVILVDDGSPDSCGDICEEFAQKDNRVKVIHKQNGGLSDARNAGFVHASGDYVIFIDSDDHIETDMLEYLYRNAVRANADIATCGAFEEFADYTDVQEECPEFVCTGLEAFRLILVGKKIRGEIWNKMIRRNLIQDLRFPKGRIYEDIYFTADLMQRVNTVAVGTSPKYHYIRREGSITGKPYNSKMLDLIGGYQKNYKVVCRHFPELKEEALCLLIWSRFVVLDKILLEKDYKSYPEYKKMVAYLKKNIRWIMANHYFQWKRKAAGILLCINPEIYRRLALKYMNPGGIMQEQD